MSTHPKYCMFCSLCNRHTRRHSLLDRTKAWETWSDVHSFYLHVDFRASFSKFLTLFIHFHIAWKCYRMLSSTFYTTNKTEKQKEKPALRYMSSLSLEQRVQTDGDGVSVRSLRAIRRMSGLSVSLSLWLAPGSFSTSQVNIHLVQNKQVVWYRTWFTSHRN